MSGGTYVFGDKGRRFSQDPSGRAEIIVAGSYVEYRGLSTDTKPAGERVGETYFEIDTTNVYMWDGSHWRLI